MSAEKAVVAVTKREQLPEVPEGYLLASYYTIRAKQVRVGELDLLSGMRLERMMGEVLAFPQEGKCHPADFARWIERAAPLSWQAEFVHPELWWTVKEAEARYNAWLARRGLQPLYFSFAGHFVGPEDPPRKRGGKLSAAQEQWFAGVQRSLPDGVFASAVPTVDPQVVFLKVWCPLGGWEESGYVLIRERVDDPLCCAASPTGSWARWWDGGGPPDPLAVLEQLLEKKITFKEARRALKELLPSWRKGGTQGADNG